MTTERDFYDILGISRDASEDQIKDSYRNLAKKWHPDLNPENRNEAEERFKEIGEAYQVLNNSEKRQVYDTYGKSGLSGSSSNQNSGANSGFQDPFDVFENVFNDLFGGLGGHTGHSQQSGDDLRLDVEISLAEAFAGLEKGIKVPFLNGCEPCNGTGAQSGHVETCPDCQGQGRVAYQRGGGFSIFQTVVNCPRCKGSGERNLNPCISCRGSGLSKEIQEFSIDIPAGVDSGNRMKLSGKGNAGKGQVPRGDLWVFFTVVKHNQFQRDGDDLFAEIELTFPQAALGDIIEVETLEKPVELTIPPGTQSGHVFTLKRLGFPNLNGRRGNLHLTTDVKVPRKLTPNQKQLMLDFAQTMDIELKGIDKTFLHKVKDALS